MRRERIRDLHTWWRIADPSWLQPLDPRHAQRHGGRWNPPNSFPVLYLNEDKRTARHNLATFVAKQPYTIDELRDEMRPALVGCHLPRNQEVCDVYSPAGLRAVGLPVTYPWDNGQLIPHVRCQPIGNQVKAASLRGVLARSAQSPNGLGRELAWFPATIRSLARQVQALAFAVWY